MNSLKIGRKALAFLPFLISILAAFLYYQSQNRNLLQSSKSFFDAHNNKTVILLEEQLRRKKGLLQSAKALFAASNEVSGEEFKTFGQEIGFTKRKYQLCWSSLNSDELFVFNPEKKELCSDLDPLSRSNIIFIEQKWVLLSEFTKSKSSTQTGVLYFLFPIEELIKGEFDSKEIADSIYITNRLSNQIFNVYQDKAASELLDGANTFYKKLYELGDFDFYFNSSAPPRFKEQSEYFRIIFLSILILLTGILLSVLIGNLLEKNAFIKEQVEEKTKYIASFGDSLRSLHRLQTSEYKSFTDILLAYLEVGVKSFGLENGIISEIVDNKYTVVAVNSPMPINKGDVYSLGDTYCSQVMEKEKTIAIPEVGKHKVLKSHPIYKNARLESYISAPIRVRNEVFGTINFSSTTIRERDFTELEIEFIELMARGIAHYVLSMRDDERRQDYEKRLKKEKKNAEDATRAKSEFLASMSHEIRTPLNAIIGMSEILADTSLNQKQSSYLASVLKASDGLLGIINDILDYSKIEAQLIELEDSKFDLADLIEDGMDILRLKASQKKIEFTLSFDPELPISLIGDSVRVKQILINLMGNAIKFTSSGGVHVSAEQISINKEKKEALVKIAVKDSGIGIAVDKQNKIFEKFSQSDSSTTRKFGGSGLGLSISKSLAEMMKGEIGVESELGKGSTFFVQIPFKMSGSGETYYKKKDITLTPKKTLIVDDIEENRTILEEFLKVYSFPSKSVGNGKDAIETFKKANNDDDPFEMLLLDIQMPEMDGLEVLRQIKELKDLQTPEIVFISSQFVEEDSWKSDASGFLMKPFKRKELSEMLAGLEKNLEIETILSASKSKHSFPHLKGKKVLAIDDIEVNLFVLKKHLQDIGVEVDDFVSAQKAYEAFESKIYDFVFMDMHMPEIDGFEATQKLREIESNLGREPVHITALTALSAREELEKTIQCGCNDYITKPYSKNQIYEKLDQILRPTFKINSYALLADDSKENQIIFGKYLKQLDIPFKIVENGKEAVELFQKEKPDLILLDIQMPVMSGDEALRQIRALEKEQDKQQKVKIIVLTAEESPTLLRSYENDGANSCLVKPFKKNQLAEEIYSLE